jgi:hypothetical protein
MKVRHYPNELGWLKLQVHDACAHGRSPQSVTDEWILYLSKHDGIDLFQELRNLHVDAWADMVQLMERLADGGDVDLKHVSERRPPSSIFNDPHGSAPGSGGLYGCVPA